MLDNTGAAGNNATVLVRPTGSLTVGAGGVEMKGLIDTLGQRTARLGFRSGTAGHITLQGDVTVTGYAGFVNGNAFTNDVRLDGTRTFTVNAAGAGLIGSTTTGYLTIADVIPTGQFTSAGSVRLTDNGANVGALVKAGIGTMEIRTPSTYTGGTTVNGGTLIASVDGSLGTGDVTVGASGALTLGTGGSTFDYINDLADVDLIGTMALNFTGTDTVGSLKLGGTPMGAGVYNAASHSTYFSGGGALTVVPEPASLALLGLGGLALIARRRRKA